MNLYTLFRQLVPDYPLEICDVIQQHPGGTSRVRTLQGNELIVLGNGYAIGTKVFIRQGVIEGQAPNNPVVLIDV